MKRWLFLLLFLPVIAFGQFRMVSSTVTLDSTVNDSTYIVDVDFFSDQTAKGYFASGITADYRVFSQTGQLYDITAASNLTLSSGELTIVEIDNNYVNTESAPVGQILVFDPQGDYITFTPFGNSNMGQVLQQAIGTYNAVVSAEGGSVPEWSGTANYEQFKQVNQDGKIYTNRTGTNTTTPPSSDLVNWELTNKSAILEEIEGRDTISQASHSFSVGDPLWYYGDYILAQDTGASVRVDGIVVEVIDANTFVRQRSGKFTLSSHGFTANIQLYVQPDGSYSSIDTSNTLVYGFPVDANTIEIGVKPDNIRNLARPDSLIFSTRNYVNGSIIQIEEDISNTCIDSLLSNKKELNLSVTYIPPILDRSGAGDGYAFSLMRLKSLHNKPVLTIENEAGDTALVYLSGGVVDTTAIKNFIGTDSIFVRQWWNQNKDIHIRQESRYRQPLLGLGGVIFRDNEGNPTIEFNNGRCLKNESATTSGSAISISTIYQRTGTGTGAFFATNFFGGTNNNAFGMLWAADDLNASINGYSSGQEGPKITADGASISSNSVNHVFAVMSADTAYMVVDGSLQTPVESVKNSSGNYRTGFSIGHVINLESNNTFGFKGYISELIIFTSDKTSDEQLIVDDAESRYNPSINEPETVTNINGHTITLPDPSTVDQNKKVRITHLDSDGLLTKVKTAAWNFRVGSVELDSLEISAALSANVTLQARNIDTVYFWNVTETNDIQYIPGSDTLGVIYLDRMSSASNLSLPVGKKIQSKTGATYTVQSDRNENFSSPFSFGTRNGNYAVYDPILGIAPINSIPFNDTLTNREKIDLLIDYLYETREVGTIYFEGDYTVSDTGTIRLPETVSIAGNYTGFESSQYVGTSRLIFAKPDTLDAIALVNRSAPTAYKPGNVIRNIQLITQNPIRAVVDASHNSGFLMKQVFIKGTGSSTEYGVIDAIENSERSIRTIWDIVDIEDCDIGVYHDGNGFNMKDVSVLRTTIGMRLLGSRIDMENCWIEDIDSSAIISSTIRLNIEDLYLESICESCPQDTSSYIINLLSAFEVNIINSTYGGSRTAIPVRMDTVKTLNFYGNNIIGGEDLDFRTISKSNQAGILNFWGNSSAANARWLEFASRNNLQNDGTNNIYGNGGFLEGNILSNLNSKNSFFEKSQNKSLSVDGNFEIITDTVSLKGPHNLLKYSEQLNQSGVWSTFSGETTVTANDTIGPDGITANAELVVGGSSANRLAQQIDTSLLEKNQRYVFGWWAKGAGVENDQWMNFMEGDAFSENTDTFFLSKTWTEYQVPIKINKQFGSIAKYLGWTFPSGDSIHIANVYFHKGTDLDAQYVQTGATASLNTEVIFDGDMSVNGSLGNVDSLKHTYNVGTDGDTIAVTQNTYALLGDADGIYYLDTTGYNGQAVVKLYCATSDTVTVKVVGGSITAFTEFGVSDSMIIIKGNGMFKEFYYQDGIFRLIGYSHNLYTGWAEYADSTYTEGSPLTLSTGVKVRLPNDAGGVRDDQIPLGIDSLYYAADSTFAGTNGSGRSMTIEFKAKPTTESNTKLTIAIDIGGIVGEIYPRDFIMTKGNGVEHYYISSFVFYTLDTWEANGGQVKIMSDAGAQVYDIRYVIHENHKPR